jgi:ABC-2 type transport system ATP-binding protein
VHGFLGPNGAGKSTTIRVLLGMLRLHGGSARLLGGDPWREAVELHGRLAYVPGDVTLWPTLTGGETIDLLAGLRGGIDESRRKALVERFQLDPTRKGRSYSKGNRQKVVLVAALSAPVELFLLDEPTSGLDPLMEEAFRETVRELRADGRTVLLSSHILDEVEALCDRVSIIREGRNVDSGTLSELRHLQRSSIDAQLRGTVDVASFGGLHDATLDGNRLRAQVDAGDLNDVLRRLGEIGVDALTCRPPTLEELFLGHYRAGAGAGAGPSRDADR